MPATDVTVNATFTRIDYTIDYTSRGQGTLTTPTTVSYVGDAVTFIAAPASEKYYVLRIDATDSSGNSVFVQETTTPNEYTFSMPAGAVTINVIFNRSDPNLEPATAGPAGVIALPLSWDITPATSLNYAFADMQALTYATLNDAGSGTSTSMTAAFQGDSSLRELTFAALDRSVGSATNLSYMLDGCTSLYLVDLQGIGTAKVNGANNQAASGATDMQQMFRGCSLLEVTEYPMDPGATKPTRPDPALAMATHFGATEMQAILDRHHKDKPLDTYTNNEGKEIPVYETQLPRISIGKAFTKVYNGFFWNRDGEQTPTYTLMSM